jgi:hypothetical protein
VQREGVSWRQAYFMPAAADRWECAASSVLLCTAAPAVLQSCIWSPTGNAFSAVRCFTAGSALQGRGAAAALAG